MHIHIYMYTHVQIYIYIYIYMYMKRDIFICIYIYIYTCIHRPAFDDERAAGDAHLRQDQRLRDRILILLV